MGGRSHRVIDYYVAVNVPEIDRIRIAIINYIITNGSIDCIVYIYICLATILSWY